jgi:hypothetical protein
MLLIEGMKGVSLEDVRFDGEERASSCLVIRGASGSSDRAHLLRRCGFRGATRALVSYEVDAAPPARGAAAPPPDEGLHIEHCRFSPRALSLRATVALALSGPEATSVDVRGCTFRGEAAAMIHASTCSLTVASCHFHNTLMPLLRTDAASTDALHDRGPTGGVDLYLDALDGNNAAVLYAQDCRSTSAQFLVTSAEATRGEGNVTVVGLHYSRGPEVTLRREPIYTHKDRPRWFWDVFEMTPVTFQPRSDSKFEATPKITAQKLPVSAANDPSGLPTKLLSGTSVGAIPDRRGFPEGGFPKYPGSLASVGVTFAPILWRLAGEDAGRLILMGCRFDFLPFDASVCVRGTPGASAIIDLGVLRSDGQIHQVSVDNDALHVEVPTWPHRM